MPRAAHDALDATSRAHAEALDAGDPLRGYRDEFVVADPDLCYLDGNSLGRLPRDTVDRVARYLVEEWGAELVAGWGHWIDEAQSVGDLIGRAALGAGPPPEIPSRQPEPAADNVTAFRRPAPKPKQAASYPAGPAAKPRLPVTLIFICLVVVYVSIRYFWK